MIGRVASFVLACACACAGQGRAEGPEAAPRSAPAPASARNAEEQPAAQRGPAAAPEPPPPAAPEPPARLDDMILVPAGPFVMGADEGGEPDERPAHEVTLPAYYLDATEVTNEAYGRCVAAGVCRKHDPASAAKNHLGADRDYRAPRQPISSISWDDAKAYCAWAGKRLPSEAEWEKAARGTDRRRFPWGNDKPEKEHAVFSAGATGEVGAHRAGDGPYGHSDLAGNVWEWVEDLYDPAAYTRAGAARGVGGSCDETLATLGELRRAGKQGFTGSNPIPTECERVLRGGAFNYGGAGLRVTNRVHHPARFRLVMSGFRCARDVPPAAKD